MRTKDVVEEGRPVNVSGVSRASSEDEVELFEMANLSTDQTGVEGVIHISTRVASHAPRIKWYPGRPKEKSPCLSVTIGPMPQVYNHGLEPRSLNAASVPVKEWVTLNYVELLEFWNKGNTWMDHEVAAFKRALKKMSQS